MNFAVNGIAAAIYAAVAFSCVRAANKDRQRAAGSARTTWLLLATLFVAAVLSRLTGFEAFVTGSFRGAAQAIGDYDQRGDLQRPLAAGVVVIATALGFLAAWRARRLAGRSAWMVEIARWSAVALLGVVALRVLSLHAIDQLLYGGGGSFRLNYVLDLGLSVTIGVCAWMYAQAERNRTPRSRRS